jgi:hypothetical protein
MGWGIAAGLGLGFVGDLLQGDKNRQATARANAANLKFAQAQDEQQREFAQNGIRWKTADAIAAGLHPLAALGTNGASYNPNSISIMPEIDDRAGAYSRMGQNLARSYQATATQDERLQNQLRLENMRLQNELLKSQITSINNPHNPPMPTSGSDNYMSGQGDSGLMLVKPSERTMSAPGRPAQEAGWRPDVSYSRTDKGLAPVIPQGLSESMEDDLIGKIFWRIRNQLVPNVTGGGSPPKSQLPAWADEWNWSHSGQEWRPSKRQKHNQPLYKGFYK